MFRVERYRVMFKVQGRGHMWFSKSRSKFPGKIKFAQFLHDLFMLVYVLATKCSSRSKRALWIDIFVSVCFTSVVDCRGASEAGRA